MPLTTDKQEEKMEKVSDFLDKFQDGDKVVIKSNLYHVDSHYLQNLKLSVFCPGEGCVYCEVGDNSRKEYLYWVERFRSNSMGSGVARVPASVFFDMNKNEKLLDKSKRDFEWIIGKEGEGKSTRYNTVRGADTKLSQKDLDEANERLEKIGDNYTKYLKSKYEEHGKDISSEPLDISEEDVDELPFGDDK